jgi:hypothetical protein
MMGAHCLLEPSLFKLGTQGHIEDIAISNAHQGKRLGISLLKALDSIGSKVGCYKVFMVYHATQCPADVRRQFLIAPLRKSHSISNVAMRKLVPRCTITTIKRHLITEYD